MAATALAYVPELTFNSDLLAGKSLIKLTAVAANGSLKNYLAAEGVDQSCEIADLAIRRE